MMDVTVTMIPDWPALRNWAFGRQSGDWRPSAQQCHKHPKWSTLPSLSIDSAIGGCTHD
jgi:hypothetical protein